MIKIIFAAMVVLLPVAVQAADPVAFTALAKGRYAAAEARLVSEVANGSEEPGVLLNLAHVYGREGRRDDAVRLYRQVLAVPNVRMEMADGSPAWSHDLAGRGMIRLSAIASR